MKLNFIILNIIKLINSNETINLNEIMDSNLILNPKSNRYVKKTSQTGLRVLKSLYTPVFEPIIEPIIEPPEPTPVQSALLDTGVEIVSSNISKFKGLTAGQTDELFKRLLLERLSISKPKSKSKTLETKATTKIARPKFRVVESSSDSSDNSD